MRFFKREILSIFQGNISFCKNFIVQCVLVAGEEEKCLHVLYMNQKSIYCKRNFAPYKIGGRAPQ